MMAFFGVSMVASYLTILFQPEASANGQGIFQTVATLTGSVIVTYFGKAGFENYDKNKKIIQAITAVSETGEETAVG